MLKIALVGCGRIAKRHSDLLGSGEIEGARLVAVCDLVEERAKTIADKYDVPCFTDLHEMMEKYKYHHQIQSPLSNLSFLFLLFFLAGLRVFLNQEDG